MKSKIVAATVWEGSLMAFAENGDVFRWISGDERWVYDENIFKQVEGKE